MNLSFDYKTYWMIFLVGAIAAGVMLVVTILLFVLLRIPAVIGDLSGRTARREIEDIRNQNTQSGTKTYKSSAVNKARGRITDKISPSGNLRRRHSGELVGAMSTARIGPHVITTPDSQPAEETTVLEQVDLPAAETTVLESAAAAVEETTVLSAAQPSYGEPAASYAAPPAAETTVLSASAADYGAAAYPAGGYGSAFAIEYEITFINTNELIQ